MKCHPKIFVYFISVLLFASCNPEEQRCFKSTGEPAEKLILLNNFNSVIVNDLFTVVLIQDTCYYVKIIGGKNLLPFVECSVENEVFEISNTNGCNWLRKYEPIRVEIGFSELKELTLYESCSLSSCDTIHVPWFSIDNRTNYSDVNINISCDTLYYRSHASTGDYVLNGICNYAYLYNRGTGYLRAEGLVANHIHIVHASTGNSYINATQLLMVENIQYGNVYSESCPEVVTQDTSCLVRLILEGCNQ